MNGLDGNKKMFYTKSFHEPIADGDRSVPVVIGNVRKTTMSCPHDISDLQGRIFSASTKRRKTERIRSVFNKQNRYDARTHVLSTF